MSRTPYSTLNASQYTSSFALREREKNVFFYLNAERCRTSALSAKMRRQKNNKQTDNNCLVAKGPTITWKMILDNGLSHTGHTRRRNSEIYLFQFWSYGSLLSVFENA